MHKSHKDRGFGGRQHRKKKILLLNNIFKGDLNYSRLMGRGKYDPWVPKKSPLHKDGGEKISPRNPWGAFVPLSGTKKNTDAYSRVEN